MKGAAGKAFGERFSAPRSLKTSGGRFREGILSPSSGECAHKMLRFARIIDTFGVGSLRSRLSRLREIRLHDDERIRSGKTEACSPRHPRGSVATEGSADSPLGSSTPLVSAPCGRVYLACARCVWMTRGWLNLMILLVKPREFFVLL